LSAAEPTVFEVLCGHVTDWPYYEALWYPDGVPGLLPGVSTPTPKPGYRVEDWTWEARRVRSSVDQGQVKLRSCRLT